MIAFLTIYSSNSNQGLFGANETLILFTKFRWKGLGTAGTNVVVVKRTHNRLLNQFICLAHVTCSVVMIPEEWGAQASSDDEVLGSARLVKLHCRAERRRTGRD